MASLDKGVVSSATPPFFVIINMNFQYDKEKENWIFEEYVRTKKSSQFVELFKKELTHCPDPADPFITKTVDLIRENWQEVADNFYEKLGVFFEQKLKEPNLTCFLVRTEIYPYDYQAERMWFAAPLFGNPLERNRVIMHELCHYFQPLELARDIKEAIPVILNDHKTFQMYAFDKGHQDNPNEQKWRKIIWETYQKDGKLSDVLKKLPSSASDTL